MNHHETTIDGDSIRIEGFPDAVKIIKVEGRKARRVADLVMHRSDLMLALECLDGINQVPERLPALRLGLWHAAIIHFKKCFGRNTARSGLDAGKVYRGVPPASAAFVYFDHLRDHHVVHDENSYDQCAPGAVLNPRESTEKIAEIICPHMKAETLNQDNFSNLRLLLTHALEWLVGEFDTLCNELKQELEAVPYDELLKREGITYRAPTLDEIGKNRGRN